MNMDSLLSRIEEENVIMVYIKDDANQAAIDTMVRRSRPWAM